MGFFYNGRGASPLLICLLGSFLVTAVCQLNCSNSYDEARLPDGCVSQQSWCMFSSITNSSLVENVSLPGQYGLCLDLPNYFVTITGVDQLEISIYINAQNISFIDDYFLDTDGDVVLVAEQEINFSNATLMGNMVWLQAGSNIQMTNSKIKKLGKSGTTCDCSTKGVVCVPEPYYFPYFFEQIKYPSPFSMNNMNYTFYDWIFQGQTTHSVVLMANDSINLLNSSLQVSIIAVYAPFVILDNSTLNNTGLGYASSTGIGCGYFDQTLNQLLGCTGTGASHGGYGGNSGPQNCNLLVSSPPYDRQSIPKYPGSGGGFFLKDLTESSSGGGVIQIQASQLNLQNNATLRADGIGGVQGGGGGSGGSISVDFAALYTSGLISISANGGDAKSSGGGGRIRFYYHNWTVSIAKTLWSEPVKISAVAGKGLCDSTLTCGQNGSVIAAPCPPGYTLDFSSYACVQCPVGTFQVLYGYQPCSQCTNKPPNSAYMNQTSLTQLSNYTSVCSFICLKDYQLYNKKQCLSSFQYLLAGVGGINLVISFTIVVATLVIFLVIMLIRKLSFSDRTIFEQNQNVDFYKKKSYFKIQDIPFHEMRIYFQGTNTPVNPWRVHPNVQRRMSSMQQYTDHMPFFSRLFRELNQLAQYKPLVGWLLNVLTVYYYPLSVLLASLLRENKAKDIRNLLILRCRSLAEDNLGIKMHVNQKVTVGCLQIFNFNRQILDFYIKNYFPIYFRIQKLLVGGYGIDFTDPLFKALCIQFQQKSNKNQKLQDYLLQLNQLLRNSDQTLSIFKHLWKINSAWPSLQCFLWQPDNNILGIQDRNQIDKSKDLFLVFSTQGRNAQMLSHSTPLVNNMSSSNSEQIVQEEQERMQNKTSQHFLYKVDLPNLFFDQISCIRHKYHLREAMVEMDEKRTIFWEVENSFPQKYLSWILGTISIIQILLNLVALFLVIFLIVQQSEVFLYVFIPYFAIFPLAQFLTLFLQLSLLISKGARVFAFTLYFCLFSAIKLTMLTIVILVLAIEDDFTDNILVTLLFIWLSSTILTFLSLLLLSMLHAHYAKNK